MLETLRYLVGSAGASGYGSKSTAEQVTENCRDLHSITAIITGATSGIGAETARVLAKRGARLVLPARNLKAAEDARARILSENPDADIIVMGLDLSSLNSVRNFVSEFESLNLPLNLLINNAGKFALEPAVSEDGIEMTFATNYLGHFLLTKLLLKKMIETAKTSGLQGRIVNVSSSIYKWFSGDMIRYLCEISRNKLRDFDPTRAYALSKLAIVLHTKEVAQRLKLINAANGGQRDGELCSSRSRQNQTHKRARRHGHRYSIFLDFEALENYSSGCCHNLLCSNTSSTCKCDREVLFGLQ
ncbi:hypothetical protein OIU84_003906 [Salix udensis]|uniref:Short-chain dehydrogenase TIC 32, chloroplastic-like n=1 Tax=Salix udensis TaxID=889485 RepID=A0AAD6P3K3_9ROSI|nr:hypothetical protein OIU84_003906 [Salix udensis]